MRMVVFAGLGMVLGYLYFTCVRHAAGFVQPQRTPLARRSFVAMVLRLAVFVLMLGTLLYRFGPLPGVAALMGAAVTRGLMIRAEPRPRPGGH